jgi:hypothetical protein
MELHSLVSVCATAEEGVYDALVDLTDGDGERYEARYIVRPGDPYGLAPEVRGAVKQWIADGNPVHPYVPPTLEQLRASMPALSRAQLLLGLLDRGITEAAVFAVIDQIEDDIERERARINFRDRTQFERTHSLIEQLAPAFGLTPDQVDAMWIAAAEL